MRCPYCDTENDESGEFCRKCGQELPQDRGAWRGPDASREASTLSSVESANKEWDPASRYSEPRSMSGFVPAARHPDYLGWSIAVLILCCLPTGIIALVCSLKVRNRHAIGDDDRAFRYSQLAKLWCWISLFVGIALYFTGIFLALAAYRRYGLSLWP